MSKTTQATLTLSRAKVAFTLHPYEYDHDAAHKGLQAAEAVGLDPARVLKTLMLKVDGKPACAAIPVDRELSMKKAAQAFGGKSAEMMAPAEAEKITGYHVGGISPFGQRKKVPVAIERSVLDFATVFINAGQRGMMAELAPSDAVGVLNARTADLTAEDCI
jgi:Cys-tRNA(Pro)/Cys-tRNA(Cys) deacylase